MMLEILNLKEVIGRYIKNPEIANKVISSLDKCKDLQSFIQTAKRLNIEMRDIISILNSLILKEDRENVKNTSVKENVIFYPNTKYGYMNDKFQEFKKEECNCPACTINKQKANMQSESIKDPYVYFPDSKNLKIIIDEYEKYQNNNTKKKSVKEEYIKNSWVKIGEEYKYLLEVPGLDSSSIKVSVIELSGAFYNIVVKGSKKIDGLYECNIDKIITIHAESNADLSSIRAEVKDGILIISFTKKKIEESGIEVKVVQI